MTDPRTGLVVFAEFDSEMKSPFMVSYQIMNMAKESNLVRTIWYDLYTAHYYSADITLDHLDIVDIDESYVDMCFVLGGILLVWLVSPDKSYLLQTTINKLEDDEVSISNGAWLTEKIKLQGLYNNSKKVLQERIERIDFDLNKMFCQYIYRYSLLFGHYDGETACWRQFGVPELEPELDYIENLCYDGTHDKLHDGGLMNHHLAGKPRRLVLKWHIMKSDYTAYFWFEDEAIQNVFERFYGAHPDTKTDFMIRIDSEKNKYELALYRYGLKEPQMISESAYQLLVFKNKFEYYRSENYNQPKGAWIW